MPAAKVSTGPPKSTSRRGLFFSALTRASASPDEKRTKLTLIPVAFSNSSNIGRAQFSGQIEYAFRVSAASAAGTAPGRQIAIETNDASAAMRTAAVSRTKVMDPSSEDSPRQAPGLSRASRSSTSLSTVPNAADGVNSPATKSAVLDPPALHRVSFGAPAQHASGEVRYVVEPRALQHHG